MSANATIQALNLLRSKGASALADGRIHRCVEHGYVDDRSICFMRRKDYVRLADAGGSAPPSVAEMQWGGVARPQKPTMRPLTSWRRTGRSRPAHSCAACHSTKSPTRHLRQRRATYIGGQFMKTVGPTVVMGGCG